MIIGEFLQSIAWSEYSEFNQGEPPAAPLKE